MNDNYLNGKPNNKSNYKIYEFLTFNILVKEVNLKRIFL
jgi:hypothetical protein